MTTESDAQGKPLHVARGLDAYTTDELIDFVERDMPQGSWWSVRKIPGQDVYLATIATAKADEHGPVLFAYRAASWALALRGALVRLREDDRTYPNEWLRLRPCAEERS